MLENQRHLFDMPDEVHYLNCAYMSPLLNSVVKAGYSGVELKAAPWKVGADDFFTQSYQARELFSGLINAMPDDIAIVPSVSYGTAIAALNLPLTEGEKVLVLAEEFPSNLYSWRVKAKQFGASIISVERPANNDWTSAVIDALEDKAIKTVVLPQTHWIDGGQLDLERIGSLRAQHEFVLVVDLTQSLGVVAVDVQTMAPDFLICATYKWLLGPYSLGFVYVHPKFHTGIPLEQGWVNRPGAQDFSRLIDYEDDINGDASRFDMGERANFHLMPMAIAALEQIHQWGQNNIEAALLAYTKKLRARLETLGFTVCDEQYRSPHYLAAQHANGLPEDILQRLSVDDIFVSKRGDNIRISAHLYNNEHDADCLINALTKIVL